MASEKTPVLLSSKLPFDDYEKERKENRPVSYLTWTFLAVLVALIIILIAQFFYWPFNSRITSWEDLENTLTNTKMTVEEISTKKQEVESATPWNFKFLIDPADLCATRNPPNSAQYAKDPEVKLLILVPSAVEHFEQRKAIRRTWGSMAERPYGPMRLGFVLGTTSNRTVDDLVQGESSQFKDIIQADFVDSHKALTTKSILMLKWVAKKCPQAQYFLKTEDDTFVNLENVARILGKEPYISQDKFISGYVQRGGVPPRPSTKAHYLTLDDYPDLQYPPYVSSSAYIMTIPTALDLFDASQVVQPILPQEDVFLTGFCAQQKDVPLFHESTFIIDDPPSPASWKTFSPLTTAHSVSPAGLDQVWDEMTRMVLDSMFKMESSLNSTVLKRLKRRT